LASNLGLYSPEFEHDACGVAFIVNIKGHKSHKVIEDGLAALLNMEHRGATGSEPDTGDGAGILIQMPDEFLRTRVSFELPPLGSYLSGIAFCTEDVTSSLETLQRICEEESLELLGLREVPRDNSTLGKTALTNEPEMIQVFISSAKGASDLALERQGLVLRKRSEHEIRGLYFPSLSTRTLIYKGMLTTPQVREYFLDLDDPDLKSAIALVHSRFSTNTFPAWSLAQPFRLSAHNGEINTIKGNRNWMRARQSLLESAEIGGDLSRIFPIVTPGGSDSASFDEVLELLHLGGRSLPHAVMMMIPEAWENNTDMDPDKREFYRFHASLMEPWDGPASIAFTDGTLIGAVLDRNGLRPSRYWVTSDDEVIMASEVGVVEVDPAKVIRKGRLQPGRMFLIDTAKGQIVSDEEIKKTLATQHPYASWIEENLLEIDKLPPRSMLTPQHSSIVTHQRLFGYSEEDLRILLAPMATTGQEPVGSMGSDTPLAVLSERPRLLFDYFTQLFAQVTNPPLDAIREEIVTSTAATIGPERNLLKPEPLSVRQIQLPYPIISNDDLAKLMYINESGETPGFSSYVVDCLYEVNGGGAALESALEAVIESVIEAIYDGKNTIILSDRHSNRELAPIPSLLFVSAVHQRLVQEQLRTKIALVAEVGDAREVHHMALLLAYGAGAINPYLAFETVVDLIRDGKITGITPQKAIKNYIKACGKGVTKIMSKMGISTIASYRGSQVYEAIGLSNEVVARYFSGTSSKIGGVTLSEISDEVLRRHRLAHLERPAEFAFRDLEVGGEYQWRREGEYHLFNPETVFKLQHSTRTKRFDVFRDYTRLVDDQSKRLATLRGLLTFKEGLREPVPIDEVEPVSEIVKRFSTGAMSYGSISQEAHETLAIAMNRLGGKSNTGEGGEDPDRFVPDANGDSRRSAIKQVASGRFGVTSEYLVNADDIQIKMAQGAKPGEGGQLPGEKVYPWIAKTRYSTPGVGLISPPPHHDIYSIEDLAQLIYDLKAANPEARVHVKLVAEAGVGTVAAGVAKAHADVILISGSDGGTGASPLNSLKHAGAPWELGLAEVQQTLLLNGLRDRVVVQTDGQLKTGRDVVIAALLGAEEFGFATAPLVVSGCIMMRVCHLDTCPVGIATQNPELRKRFSGKPEFVETFFEFLAEEVRQYLAKLGFRSIQEAVGHSELLDVSTLASNPKAKALDLAPMLKTIDPWPGQERSYKPSSRELPTDTLDYKILELCRTSIRKGTPYKGSFKVKNTDRTVGTTVGYELTKTHGGKGLPDDTIYLHLEGSAGQSLGAFLPRGITIDLEGDANDYVGKGLSGGKIVLKPHRSSPFVAEDNIIAGNVLLYGATSGELYVRGIVGERFAVRNSGATAVVEGVGDHGCEYMTGGRVIVLGPTGRNFGAGMSGGEAYLYDPDGLAPRNVNPEMVDLDPLSEEDVAFIKDALEIHHTLTGSSVANAILQNFEDSLASFVKVFPRDYKAVLAQKDQTLELTGVGGK
jgi:glutamate synthase (NADPH/NADH) large chain